jgi:hypothetical protein
MASSTPQSLQELQGLTEQPQAQQPTDMDAPAALPQQQKQKPKGWQGMKKVKLSAPDTAAAASNGAGAPAARQPAAAGATLDAAATAATPPTSIAQPAPGNPASFAAPNPGVQAGAATTFELAPAPGPTRASGRRQGRGKRSATATANTALQQGNPALPGEAPRHGRRGYTSQAADPGGSEGARPAKHSKHSHPGAEVQGPSPGEQQLCAPEVVMQEQPQGRQVSGGGMELRSGTTLAAPARHSEPQALGPTASRRGQRAIARGGRATHTQAVHPAPQPTASVIGAASALVHLSSCPAKAETS